MRWMGHVICMGEIRNAYKVLIRRPEGKRALERPPYRWEVNIRMDLREIGWENVDWIHLVQDRNQWQALVNTYESLGSMKVGKCLE
jgi:hypothetical protein